MNGRKVFVTLLLSGMLCSACSVCRSNQESTAILNDSLMNSPSRLRILAMLTNKDVAPSFIIRAVNGAMQHVLEEKEKVNLLKEAIARPYNQQSSLLSKNSKTSEKKRQKWSKNLTQTGIASWYGRPFHGQKTASGHIYNMYELTAAHKKLPLHTLIKVTNLENNKAVILEVNDRGPYVGKRILDVSYAAAKKLDFVSRGTTPVKLKVVSLP